MPERLSALRHASEFRCRGSSCLVRAQGLKTARDIIAHDAQQGRINLGYSREVRDEAGETVHTLYFSQAVKIIGAE